MKKLRRIDANKANGPFDLSLKLIIKVIRRVLKRNTIMRKFANFVRLYFPHITTFFNQILGFYYFYKVLSGNLVFVV